MDEYGTEHIVPTAKIRLVNATGAGDSMVAGFLAKTTAGYDYDTALIYASACGTATAASRGIAKRATIDRVVTALYKKMAEKCLLLSQKRFSLLARKRRAARASHLGWQILSSNHKLIV